VSRARHCWSYIGPGNCAGRFRTAGDNFMHDNQEHWQGIKNNDHTNGRGTPGGTETILLVEDEPVLRRVTGRLLVRHGYRVLEACSGEDALEIWRDQQNHIDLVLTDMMMPDGISGPDLVEKFKLEKPGVYAIFTSGYRSKDVGKGLALTEGVNFLQKPCAFAVLAQTLRNTLDGQYLVAAAAVQPPFMNGTCDKGSVRHPA